MQSTLNFKVEYMFELLSVKEEGKKFFCILLLLWCTATDYIFCCDGLQQQRQ